MVLYPCESFTFENKLIGDIIKEYPEASEIIKYFWEIFLERLSFKIKTPKIICILFGAD
jgi:hypothetical protein